MLSNKQIEIIKQLEAQEISVQNIVKTDELGYLLPSVELDLVRKTARYSVLKYVRKKGVSENEEIKERVRKGFTFRRELDAYIRVILGHYGIAGGIYIDYARLGYRVAKIVKESNIATVPHKILTEIDYWAKKYNLNKTILKTIALTASKLAYKHYHS